MSVLELLEYVKSSSDGVNCGEVLQRVNREWARTKGEDERLILLQIFVATARLFERSGRWSPEKLREFRDTWIKNYHTFLVEESLVGTNISTETLSSIVQREIAAGRMEENDTLKKIAQDAMGAPHLSRAELEAMVVGNAEGQ